jgi:hypothetical protein
VRGRSARRQLPGAGRSPSAEAPGRTAAPEPDSSPLTPRSARVLTGLAAHCCAGHLLCSRSAAVWPAWAGAAGGRALEAVEKMVTGSASLGIGELHRELLFGPQP